MRARERYYFESLKATLNKLIPSRTNKEYYEENKEELKERNKEYYKELCKVVAIILIMHFSHIIVHGAHCIGRNLSIRID